MQRALAPSLRPGKNSSTTPFWTHPPESRSLETSVVNEKARSSQASTPRSSSPVSHSRHPVSPGLCPRSSPGNGRLTTWARPLMHPTDPARAARQGDASSQASKRLTLRGAGHRWAHPPPSSPSPTSRASEIKPRAVLGRRAHPPRIASPPPRSKRLEHDGPAPAGVSRRLQGRPSSPVGPWQLQSGAVLVGLRGLTHHAHPLGASMPLLPQLRELRRARPLGAPSLSSLGSSP